MKILLITETICAGGAETFVLRMARKFGQLGHHCDILNLNPDLEDDRLVAQYPEINIHRAQIPAVRWIKRFDRLLRLLKIDVSVQHLITQRIFRTRYAVAYDVYHSHLYNADNLLADGGTEHAGLVTTIHGDYLLFVAEEGKGRVLNLDRKVAKIFGKLDRVVYISDHQKDFFRSRFDAPLSKFRKIYNGFELPGPERQAAPELRSAGVTFIMAARGIKEKGWETAIKAFQGLKGDARLVLVGESAYLDNLHAAYADDQRIEFTGFHPAPTDLLLQADVFVFPSVYKSESLPTVVVEALCCGIPVISTQIGEVKDMITAPDGELAGQLVPIGEDGQLVSAFAAAMQRYLDDAALREEHSTRAAGAFAKFDMESCARHYLAVYEEACLAHGLD